MAERHKPTPETRKQVEEMAGFGLNRQQICTLLGMTRLNTLSKLYKVELARGAAKCAMGVGRSINALAMGAPAEFDEHGKKLREEVLPDKSAAIFMAKIKLGYTEVSRVEVRFFDEYDLDKLTIQELRDLERLLAKAKRTGGPAGDSSAGDQPERDRGRAKGGPGRGRSKRRGGP